MKHLLDELLQRLYRNSDDDLLREFKEVEAEAKAEGCQQSDPDGFERLWKKLTNKI